MWPRTGSWEWNQSFGDVPEKLIKGVICSWHTSVSSLLAWRCIGRNCRSNCVALRGRPRESQQRLTLILSCNTNLLITNSQQLSICGLFASWYRHVHIWFFCCSQICNKHVSGDKRERGQESLAYCSPWGHKEPEWQQNECNPRNKERSFHERYDGTFILKVVCWEDEWFHVFATVLLSMVIILILHTCISLFGEGNGNPLQYSCLEDPTDKGAWWATVHGVAKSRTRLSE